MEGKDYFADGYHYYCHEGIDPEAIVISGISGRFPMSENVGEYKDAVYAKRSLIEFTDERFAKGVFKNPYSSCGNIKNTDKVDAGFFFLTHAAVHGLDPATRIHQEVAYECIFDAGYNPDELKGANIGVYNATTGDDGQRINLAQNNELQLHNIRTMHPNRSSYIMDLKGPSHTIDSACSSSAIAFHSAVCDLRLGNVDGAIASGCQLNLDPEKTTAYFMAGIASLAGNSVPYDAESDGMLRTEAISAVFLQKAKHARRIYAVVLGSKYQSSGYVPEGISVPSRPMQIYTLGSLLNECGVHPNQIQYLEGHGTGTQVGDPIEANAMAELFLNEKNNRIKPLYMGSSKSNIGHTEATSGLVGIINAIFAFETNLIPPNIRYKNPNFRCQALVDGKIIVPTDPIPIESPYIPINSFGFGGTIVEVLLKRGPVPHRQTKKEEGQKIPRLLLYSATTEEAVTFLFDYIKTHEDPGEAFYAMLSKLAYTPPFAKPYRGYSLFYDLENPVIQTKAASGDRRPVWFIMTGMGCQWAGMGLQLMTIDVFARSMYKSAAVLKSLGIDLFELLRADKNYLDLDRKILNAFVCISAIQIGLVDLLRHVGIEPDGIIGHSTGEIICAYADGCCTAEETIMSAYYRGICVEAGSDTLVRGSMAAVGLSWEECVRRCPEGIFPACDNSADSVTISGLQEPVDKFVEELKKENIFARVVNAYGYAFHSKYVHPIAGDLKNKLKSMLTNPKRRSPRWVSTSYPEEEWGLESAQVADAEYFVHNLMSPVRFTAGLRKIPSNAVTIEVGPHHLLQSILKRGCGAETSHIGLMKRNHEDNVSFFFEALGKLYNEGLDPKIERLYPPVKFPVPSGSPILSDLLKWNHSLSFRVPKYTPRTGPVDLDLRPDKGDAYLLDHRIDGKSLFPATGYIWLVWEVFAFRTHRKLDETPVVIEHFKIHRATVITPQSAVRMTTSILTGTGYFEIKEGGQLVASGYVKDGKDMAFDEKSPIYRSEEKAVSGADLYNELKMAGYEYGPNFQSLVEMSMNGTGGLINWRNKWIPFLDCMLLFFGIIEKRHKFYLPTGARMIKLDPLAFREFISKKVDETTDPTLEYPEDTVPVNYNPHTKVCRSVGIEIKDLELDIATLRASTDVPTTEEYKFVPYISAYTPDDAEKIDDLTKYMGMCNQVMKNLKKASKKNITLTEFPAPPIEEDIEEYLTSTESNDRVLLNLLVDLSKDLSQTSKLSTFATNLGLDILNNVLVDADVLRSMMELIMENSNKKLSILELNQNFSLVLPALMEMSAKYSHLKYKKVTMVVPTIENVNEEVVSKHNIELLEGNDLESLGLTKKEDILISSFTTGSEAELEKLITSLTAVLEENGCILLYFKEKLSPGEKFVCSLGNVDPQIRSQTDLLRVLQKKNLTVLSKVSDSIGGGALYLLRSVAVAEHPDKVIHIKEGTFAWVEEVKKELYEGESDGRLWIVSQDSPVSGIVGFITCLKQEPKGNRIRCVFICQNPKEQKLPTFDLENPIYKPLSDRNMIMNVWKDGAWGSYRHVLIKEHKKPQLRDTSYLYVYKTGDFSSMKWTESPAKCTSVSNIRTLVHVYYSALNFKDVMLASGKINLDPETTVDNAVCDSLIGMEFSGRTETGRRVFGLIGGSGICTTIMASSNLLDVPDHWSLEDAATVAVVYSTCYYALLARGKLSRGESILIHSGTGGIGIAAIRIALSLGCEIFTTVGTEEKKLYLKKLFPQIKDENIGSSRDISFEKMVMDGTKGLGVNVVLNSLSDEKFHASLRCVARFGRFIEIGKYDMLIDTRIGMKFFMADRQFHGIALDMTFDLKENSRRIFDTLMDMVKEGMMKGVVQPMDRKVFQWDEVEDAFRFMAKGVHMGKLLIKIRDEEKSKVVIPKPLALPVIPKTFFYDSKVYVIIGGLGGFGIELTNWMIIRGARKVILTTRYGARTPYHFLCLSRWKRELVDVRVSTLNVTKRNEAEKLLKEASQMGPVGGIFNSAVVLKDAFMDSQTPDDFKEVCDPKGTATLYLDELSRTLCPKLDYFVCFSSMSCGRGNAGQTNYGFANSMMERICEERKRAGLHGLSIQWGIIGGVGVVHRHMGDDAMIAGVIAQNVKSCLATLDDFLQEKAPVVSSYMTAVERKALGSGDILTKLGKILGMNVNEINPGRSFGTMGIDSMVGVELKQLLDSSCGTNLTLQEIQDMKIGDVKEMLEKVEADKSSGGGGGSGLALMATSNLRLPPNLINDTNRLIYNQMELGYPVYFLKLGDENVDDLGQLIPLIERPVGVTIWHSSYPTTDIAALAERLYKDMSSEWQFDLVACSLSANIALAIGLHSQKTDKRCKSIIIMNGSDVLLRILNPEESEEEDKEIGVLCRFVEQFGAVDTFKLKEDLKKAPNLDQRIKALAQFIEPLSSRSIEKAEISAAVQNYILKNNLAESFKANEKLARDITLIEDPMKVLPNDVTKIKETFSKVVTGKVNVHRLCSMRDLMNPEEALKVANIISANYS